MTRTSWIISIFLFAPQILIGQSPEQSTLGSSQQQSRYLVSSDPSNLSFLFSLLRDPYVCQELQLSEVQLEAISGIQRKAYADVRKARADHKGKEIPTPVLNEINANRELPKKTIDEILLPAQLERLRQLAFRKEITLNGYAHALNRGRLGSLLGVANDQKSAIDKNTARILGELDRKTRQLERELEGKVAAELSTEQRSKFQSTLGEFFAYRLRSLPNEFSDQFWRARLGQDESISSDRQRKSRK